MTKYINDKGNEVPENKIVFVNTNSSDYTNHNISDIIEPLLGQPKRDWFDDNFYRCLPLTIANQYGFILKSAYDFSMFWDGQNDSIIELESEDPEFIKAMSGGNNSIQKFAVNFRNGILSVINFCVLRTPPGINIMVMQPPNMINNPDLFCMSGVVESDNLRPAFTFNLKILAPNKKIFIKKGDVLSGFVPIQRYFVENFSLEPAESHFDKETLTSEQNDIDFHTWERQVLDPVTKKHGSGRRYFNGIHGDESKYKDHQKNFRNLLNKEKQED
jgi:hypothetical protein